MSTQFQTIEPYAENQSNPVRSLTGVINMGAVTLGNYYGDGVTARWLYVGTTGNVTIIKIDGTTQTLNSMAAGVFHPIHHIGVAVSGTTAGGLVWGN